MMRWLWVVVLLAACPKPQATSTSTGGFRVFYPDPPIRGVVGKHLQVHAVGDCHYPDGREGRWANTGARVTSGELPDGLALEDGAIAGVPKAAGTTRVTLAFTGVTCAGKAVPDQTVDVSISVTAAR